MSEDNLEALGPEGVEFLVGHTDLRVRPAPTTAKTWRSTRAATHGRASSPVQPYADRDSAEARRPPSPRTSTPGRTLRRAHHPSGPAIDPRAPRCFAFAMPFRAAPLALQLAALISIASTMASPAHATDAGEGLERARTLAILAEGRLAAGLPAEAAPLYERAANLDPRPSFWLAAAEAWVDATYPERAVTAFERALALASPAGRSGIEEQRRLATAMAALTAEARRATSDGRHAAAADRWYEAAALSGSHRYELEAARALSRARRIPALREALPRLIERSGWSAEERAALDDLRDLAQTWTPPPPQDPSSPAPWVLIFKQR